MVVALLLPSSGATAQQVKLKATLQAPLSNPFYGVSLARLKEEVEKQSAHAIVIEIFDKSQLLRDEQTIEGVASGAVDIGITASHQFSSRVPAVAIIDQPFLFNFDALSRAAVNPDSEIRKLIDDTIRAQLGVRILWWQSLGDHVIYSHGRDVADPERLNDQKVAVPGMGLVQFVTRCGGIPSTLPIEDINGALKEGRVTATIAGIAALHTRELWKVADNITRTLHAPLEFLLFINERTWQSLSPEHRALIGLVARAVERETRDRLAEFQAKGYAFAASKGMKIQDLTPDQVAEWRVCTAEMLAQYMERNGDLARRLMSAYAKLRTEPCCTAAPSTIAFTRR
jgi:TRAP-type C4-dicarboxylate transport system substrate-binding protein